MLPRKRMLFLLFFRLHQGELMHVKIKLGTGLKSDMMIEFTEGNVVLETRIETDVYYC